MCMALETQQTLICPINVLLTDKYLPAVQKKKRENKTIIWKGIYIFAHTCTQFFIISSTWFNATDHFINIGSQGLKHL